MKWVIVAGFLVLMVGCGGGSVIRCTPENHDGSCSEIDLHPPAEVSLDSAESTRQVECLAGSEWESNCHSCRCSDSGFAECLKQETCGNAVLAEPLQCKPHTTFQRKCNTCVCLESGLALCSAEACRRSGIPKKPELLSGKDCAPGSAWKDRCNDCRCSDDGYSVCTLMICEEQSTESAMRCAPDTVWKNDCNTCWCTTQGRALCTKIGCVTITDLNLKEDSKSSIDKEFTGLITKSSKNNTKELICVANRMFIKDCNTCWCNDDGTSYFCTRKVCVPDLPDEPNPEEEKPEELRIIKKECRPDEVFELDCNMCRCNPDGKSFSCTRRACVDQEDAKNTSLSRKVRATPQEAPKTCQPGQEFRLDCNKCLCDNEGQDFSCTRIDCNNNNGGARSKREVGDLKEIPKECTPGSVFQRDCNACRCTNDGQHAMCTTKQCQQEDAKGNNLDSDVHTTDVGFRCTPGEQLRRDCNDCTCSADGKNIFCTLRLCDQDINPDI